MSKDILFITLHIFPVQTPRSLRSTELIQELARRGYNVTVYAVLGRYDYSEFLKENPGITLKNIKLFWQIKPSTSDGFSKGTFLDRGLRFILSKFFLYPYFEFYFRVPDVIKNEVKHDILISIADPHMIHWGCSRAKKKYPSLFPDKWVADCGDPFMENGATQSYYSYFEKFERRFCDACDFITVPHENAIWGYYPEYYSKIRVIPQGFQFDLSKTQNETNTSILTFGYAGVFLKDIRNPEKFLEVLAGFQQDFRFIVYTAYDDLLQPFYKKLGERLVLRNPVPRKDLLEELKKMDFVVNLENYNTPTAVPSKLIDYAITGRPILSINPEEPDKELICEFFRKDYRRRFKVLNLAQYHIRSVVDSFELLW